MSSSKDVYGEPRASTQLRKLVPLNDRADVDGDDGAYSSCSCPPRPKSPSPRRVRFADEEDVPPPTPSRTAPPTPAPRRTPAPATASASLSDCLCPSGAAARKPTAPARTPSSCSCDSLTPCKAADVEYLYPSRSRSKSPCPVRARHTCSLASNDPLSFSASSTEASAPKAGVRSPCSPPRRLLAEELVERRQPSWWEPALSRVLSVLVSTVLLLATGGAQPSPEHLSWTKDFLRCVKDRGGNPPPNVAALLAYLETLEKPAASDAPAVTDNGERTERTEGNDRASRTSRVSRVSRVSL